MSVPDKLIQLGFAYNSTGNLRGRKQLRQNPVPDKTFFKRVDDTMLEMYARGTDDTQWERVVLNVDTQQVVVSEIVNYQTILDLWWLPKPNEFVSLPCLVQRIALLEMDLFHTCVVETVEHRVKMVVPSIPISPTIFGFLLKVTLIGKYWSRWISHEPPTDDHFYEEVAKLTLL